MTFVSKKSPMTPPPHSITLLYRGLGRAAILNPSQPLLSIPLFLFFNLKHLNPRPPEPFSVTHPPKGGGVLLQPPLDFL